MQFDNVEAAELDVLHPQLNTQWAPASTKLCTGVIHDRVLGSVYYPSGFQIVAIFIFYLMNLYLKKIVGQ